jgi:hypothetical protein
MRKTRFSKIQILNATMFLAAWAAFSAGCAKVGEPQPPEIHIPKPAADLTAHQVSNAIVLKFTKPLLNTDGSSPTTLARVEVFRLFEDLRQGLTPNPLPEEQFVQSAARILSIASPSFPGFLQAESFIVEDTPELPDKSSIYSHAFRYAVLFINKKNQAAGFSNQAFIAPVAIPLPPAGISASVMEDAIRLSWVEPAENMDGSKPPRFVGYNIYKSKDPQTLPSVPVNPNPLQKPEYEDRDFQFDQTYNYAIRMVGSSHDPYAVSLLSDILRVEARDTFPPAPPESFHAVREGSDVVLLWVPPESPDVAGYRIYRLDKKSGSRALLQKDLITALSIRDRQVESEKQYEYSIQAVDAHGNESAPVRTEVDIR